MSISMVRMSGLRHRSGSLGLTPLRDGPAVAAASQLAGPEKCRDGWIDLVGCSVDCQGMFSTFARFWELVLVRRSPLLLGFAW